MRLLVSVHSSVVHPLECSRPHPTVSQTYEIRSVVVILVMAMQRLCFGILDEMRAGGVQPS